jgi:hypothetical protein
MSYFELNAQVSRKSYSVIEKTLDFNLNLFDQVDLSLLDLYRAADADNKMTLNQNGESITIILLSAKKCIDLGVDFNSDMVEKGMMMGTKPHVATSFVFRIENHNKLTDLTVY